MAGAASALLRLRPGSAADALLIADMHARSRAVTYRGALPDAYLDIEMPVQSRVEWTAKMQALGAGAGQVLIAERAGEPVGFICMLAPDAQASVLVDNLHLLPDRKGGGAGTAMLLAAQDWAREQGAAQLHLLVLDSNAAAIGFYESRGWRLDGHRDDVMGGTPIVARVYVLPLDQGPSVRP